MSRSVRIPGPDHPITVEPGGVHVVVKVGGHVVADSTKALALREADYPVAWYVPREDVDAAVLSDSATTTYCPYKGDASYVTVTTPEGSVEDAAWSYVEPYEAVAPIAGHLAFYPNRAEIVVEDV